MKKIIVIGLFFLFVYSNSIAADNDSLYFLNDVKEFALKKLEIKDENYYTIWQEEKYPRVLFFVSLPNKIKSPGKSRLTLSRNGNSYKRSFTEKEYIEKEYHTFRYKTYADASTTLNSRFLSYSREAQSFIVFHELTHNWIDINRIELPYEFIEALCDLIGNYGTLSYAHSALNLHLRSVKKQIRVNEKLYKYFNRTISNINKSHKNVAIYNARCNKKVQTVKRQFNCFQKDRFDYEVNNAYLFKNSNYCKNYFLLKKVLKKRNSIKDFLEFIKSMPFEISDYEKYFEGFD